MANGGVSIPITLDMDISDIKKQGQSLSNILERALNKNTRVKALDNLEKQIIQARDDMKIIQGALTRLMTTPVRTRMFDDAIKQAQDYKAIIKEAIAEIKTQRPQYANFSNKDIMQAFSQPGKHHSVQTPNFGMVNLSKTIKDLQTAQKLCNDLVKTGKAFEINQGAIDLLKKELGESEDKVRDLLTQMQQLSFGSGNWIQNSLQPLINFNQEISQTMGAFSQAFGPYVQIATTAIQGLVKVTEMEVKALAKLGQVAISAFKPLVSLAQLAGSAIKKMFDSIKKHNETTMKNLWRNILRYGIGVRSFYFLARKIRAAIGDVINELARQIPEVNAKMSEFKTAVNGLKGSLATAFQPILTAVLPILTKLINMVSRAIAVVGQFFALLTGQKFVYAATATQVDYAASLDKTGKSAKKAKKELEGYLSPIDEINKYQSKKDDDSGGDGGGGDYTLKKVPIDDWMKDFWDRIKKAWEHADFFDIGKELGDKIAKALANIPWAEIRAKARQLGRSLATLLNGLMYGEFNGKSLATYIGQTIAGAINTAFDFVDSYISEFDFAKFGQSIMEAIAGVLDNLDWNLITGTLARLGTGIGQTLEEIFSDFSTWAKAGEAFAKAINAIIYSVFNIFNEIEGSVVGAALSRFLNKFIEWIDSAAFVTTCNEIMRDMLDALIVAVATTHWDELGTKLAEIISGIDFKGIFQRYARLASEIIDAILDLLESFLDGLTPDKLEEIGDSIANAIKQIDFQPKRFGEVANKLLHALLDIISEVAQDQEMWDKLGEDIRTALEQVDWKDLFAQATSILTAINEGLLELLQDALKGVFGDIGYSCIVGFIEAFKTVTHIKDLETIWNFFKDIIRTIKDMFGIHSPSTVFRDIGNSIVLGFINGIQTIVAKAKQVWESLKTTTVSVFNNIWTSIKGVINSIIGGVEAMANGIVRGLNKAIEAMNNLQFDVPGWVPIVGGNHLGFNIPTINEIRIPPLAQGAVIPPNKEFLAMLGDQKSGTNIETPLQTMVDAFNMALQQNGGTGGVKQITFVLPDRREIAKYAIEGGRVIQTSTGKNPFDLA